MLLRRAFTTGAYFGTAEQNQAPGSKRRENQCGQERRRA